MRNFSLSGIRARVDRLAATVNSECDGHHVRIQVSDVIGNDPVPAWPAAGAPTHCRCGAALVYRHVINELHPDEVSPPKRVDRGESSLSSRE